MVPNPKRRRMPCVHTSLLFAMLLAAQAQAQSPTTIRPDPLDSKAQVPAVLYQSPFVQFRRLGDDNPVAWREANDTVTRIGGWRVYAREAQQPDATAAEKPAAPVQAPAAQPAPVPAPAAKPMPMPMPMPMPAGHSGHKH